MPITLTLDPAIQETCPDLRLGHLLARVQMGPSPDRLWEAVSPQLTAKATLSAEDIRALPALAAARAAYKALGQDPSRYRLSAEALHRRLSKGQPLYRLSNVVDLINLASLHSGISIGGYDRKRIQGEPVLRVGQAGEPYESIGRGPLNIAHLPVLADQVGAFGSPTSDSARTAIGPQTTDIWLVLFGFGATDALDATLDFLHGGLQQFAAAEEVEIAVQWL